MAFHWIIVIIGYPIELGVMYPLIIGYVRRELTENPLYDGWLTAMADRAAPWAIMNEFQVHGGFKIKRERNTMREHIRDLLTLSGKNLGDLMGKPFDEDNSSFTTLQAQVILQEEYRARTKGGNRGNGVSLINHYPSLIRHAGRLQPQVRVSMPTFSTVNTGRTSETYPTAPAPCRMPAYQVIMTALAFSN